MLTMIHPEMNDSLGGITVLHASMAWRRTSDVPMAPACPGATAVTRSAAAACSSTTSVGATSGDGEPVIAQRGSPSFGSRRSTSGMNSGMYSRASTIAQSIDAKNGCARTPGPLRRVAGLRSRSLAMRSRASPEIEGGNHTSPVRIFCASFSCERPQNGYFPEIVA
eukprot:Amastigsp_a175794_31.p4 type:complete len:166 gc:universal Amastigsp_a175794_31:685-1182(+)